MYNTNIFLNDEENLIYLGRNNQKIYTGCKSLAFGQKIIKYTKIEEKRICLATGLFAR